MVLGFAKWFGATSLQDVPQQWVIGLSNGPANGKVGTVTGTGREWGLAGVSLSWGTPITSGL